MSIAYGSRVGSASGATSVSSFSATTSGSIAAGSLIIVSVSCSNVGDTNNLSSVTDAAGNTYVSGAFTVDGGQNTLTAVWYCANCLALASSSLVTAHLSSALLTGGESWRIAVDYATGIATTSVTDGSQGKNSQTGATWNTGTGVTTTNAADLLWVANGINQGEPTAIVQADCSPTTGWTLQTSIINGGNSGDSLRTAYNIVAVTGTYHGGGTCTTASNGDSAVIVAFKGASGGGTVSGSGSMVGNGTVASGGASIESGADASSATGLLPGPANIFSSPEPLQQNSALGGSASLRAGTDTLSGNAALSGVASLVSSGSLVGSGVFSSPGAVIAIGPGSLSGSSVLSGGAFLLAGPEDLVGNSILLNPSISSGGSLVGNALLSGAGIIVSGGSLQGNGLLSGYAHLLAGAGSLSGAGLLLGPATLLTGPESLVGNSLLFNPSISSGGSLTGNSLLFGSGTLVAGGTLSGNTTLSGPARILAALLYAQSSGVLSGSGILVAGPESLVGNALILSTLLKIPGIVFLSDLALALAILSDTAPVAILSDIPTATATLGDEYGQ